MAVVVAVACVSAGAGELRGQELTELCPDASPPSAAVWGFVHDLETEVVIPMAMLDVRWAVDGQDHEAYRQAGVDGGYVLCSLPREVDISVQASLAGISDSAVTLTLTEEITWRDFTIALQTGGVPDTPLMVCTSVLGAPDQLESSFPHLIRCRPGWPDLELCPRIELGPVDGDRTGVGIDVKEQIERFVEEARRLGANAIIRVQPQRGAGGNDGGIEGLAVRIPADPTICAR